VSLLRDWLARRLKSGFGLIAIVGGANADPPAIAFDRVDGAPAPYQQIDRVGDLVLAASGGLEELTGVEDGGGDGVNAGPNEIRGGVLGCFDDVDDLAVRVGVTDAIAACVLGTSMRKAASARSSRWRRTTSSRLAWKTLSPSMNGTTKESPRPSRRREDGPARCAVVRESEALS
jgi:hypothetical protein